jgi:hypothetical protein
MSNQNTTGSIGIAESLQENLTPFEKAEISVAKFYTNIRIEQKLREILERIERSKKALDILSRALEEEKNNSNGNEALIARASKKKTEIEQEIEFLELTIKLFFEVSSNNISKV